MDNKLVFIGLCFGAGENHGISNYYIAKNVAEEMHVEQCAGIVQWELYEIIQEKFFNLIEGLPLYVMTTKGKDLDTFDVLCRAAGLVQEKGFRYITYVGHPALLWLVRSIAFKLGIPEYEKRKYQIPYDPNSSQWRTRSWWQFWFFWEIPVIILWSFMGRL